MATTLHDVRLGEIYYYYLLELARGDVGSTIRYGELVARAKNDYPNDEIVNSAIPISIGKRLFMIEDFCIKHHLPNLACLAVNASGQPGDSYINNWQKEKSLVAAFDWTTVSPEWSIHVDQYRAIATQGPKLTKRSRAESEAEFTSHWRLDSSKVPPLYPNRLENNIKELIIRQIEKGHDPADAFAAALFPDSKE